MSTSSSSSLSAGRAPASARLSEGVSGAAIASGLGAAAAVGTPSSTSAGAVPPPPPPAEHAAPPFGGGAGPAGSASLQVLLAAWRAVDLDSRRAHWDACAAAVVDNKESSLECRRRLAAATKAFRTQQAQQLAALPPAAQAPTHTLAQAFGPLLRLYQEEIDRLTRRAKFGEGRFVEMYQLLADAPNPVPGLTAAAAGAERERERATLEFENAKMAAELREFRREVRTLQNQEVTVRRQSETIAAFEVRLDAMAAERAAEIESRLGAQRAAAEEAMREREEELRRGLGKYQAELARLHRMLESANHELQEMRTQSDRTQTLRQSELELLSEELGRSLSRVSELERERERGVLRDGAATPLRGAPVALGAHQTDRELELVQKEIEISRLRESLARAETAADAAEQLRADKAALGADAERLRADLAAAEQRLAEAPSHEQFHELRRQLATLQHIEFPDGAAEDAPLERLLVEKNRRLETHLVQDRVALSQKREELAEALQEASQYKAEAEELRRLVARLEDDLAAQVRGTGREMRLSAAGAPGADATAAAAFPSSSGHAATPEMLEVVCSQRDRFKVRLDELESENSALRGSTAELQEQVRGLKEDNVKLFGKIRFLQSYSHHQPAQHREDVEGRYFQMYEESMDPFVLFNRRERHRRYAELRPYEKAILKSGRFFLSTKGTRLCLFVYAVVLHVLVFLTLYKLAVSSVPECIPEIHGNYLLATQQALAAGVRAAGAPPQARPPGAPL